MSETSKMKDEAGLYPAPLPKPDACCESPCDPAWGKELPCLYYNQTLTEFFNLEGQPVSDNDSREYIEVVLTLQHSLCLVGKQHGGLAYTLTLLPGEKMTLYHSDRYRRTTTEDSRYSVQTTFNMFTSALFQAQSSNDFSAVNQVLNNSASSSGGGGGLSVNLGIVSFGGGGGGGSSNNSSSFNGSTFDSSASTFAQVANQASLYTDMQRSITISSYEDTETATITSRTFQNDNPCRPVTYFVRKVVDLYVATTKVAAILLRVVEGKSMTAWLTPAQIGSLPAAFQGIMKHILSTLPTVGHEIEQSNPIAVPTDGVVYDPELSHCCTCDPEREEQLRIGLERARAEAARIAMEARLMEQEVKRRELLLAAGTLTPFNPPPATP